MPTEIKTFTFSEVVECLRDQNHSHKKNYLSMYSSWIGGIITDPSLMMIPVDDHLVHRGDGIFEAMKCVNGNIYAMDRHLDRLLRSAEMVHMSLPLKREELVNAIVKSIQAANVKDCLVRLYVSRGPGGFTTNPYECVGSQLYVVITMLKEPAVEKYSSGVTLKTSGIPVKEGIFANVKSCNYMANVLMKKEAVDAGVDFTVSLDERGFLGEGSTENIGIVTKKREFLVPGFGRTLRGITVTRVMELAQALLEKSEITRISEADIRPEHAYEAAEVMLFGTTIDILPVARYDGHDINEGMPGPVYKRLLQILRSDVATGSEMLTAID